HPPAPHALPTRRSSDLQVHQLHKTGKVDADVVVNRLPDKAADRIHCQARAAARISSRLANGIGRVDLGLVTKARNRNPEVARQRDRKSTRLNSSHVKIS